MSRSYLNIWNYLVRLSSNQENRFLKKKTNQKKMNEKIHVIGHKSPDTDTVVSAIVTADFLQKRDGDTVTYVPNMTGKCNDETVFVEDTFGLNIPHVLTDAKGLKLFLVDHNEESQQVKGDGEIVGIIDHHKIVFESAHPIDIMVKPWGCTCTILYDLYEKYGFDIPQELKAPMLCAILSDTVITKSPTTTQKDIEVIVKLSTELKLDYKKIGMDMFKAKAKIADKTSEEIIMNDFKDFDFDGKKVGVGQIETPDLTEIEGRVNELKTKMLSMREVRGYHTIILMLTDIIEAGSKLLIVSEDEEEEVAEWFDTKVMNSATNFIPGMMSRKKQVAPVLSAKFS